MSHTDEDLDRFAERLASWPANGKPVNDETTQTLKAYGLIEEHVQHTNCRECGTPRPDYYYLKITPAGKLFLAAARKRITT